MFKQKLHVFKSSVLRASQRFPERARNFSNHLLAAHTNIQAIRRRANIINNILQESEYPHQRIKDHSRKLNDFAGLLEYHSGQSSKLVKNLVH